MPRNPLAWYPHYVSDWLTDERVRSMSYAERGLYHDLMMFQWIEGSLPADEAELTLSLSKPSDDCVHLLGSMLDSLFPLCSDGRRRNSKLASIRQAQIQLSQRRSRGGRKGGKAASSAKARLKLSRVKTKTDIYPLKVPTSGDDELREAFETFWASYPPRSGANPRAKAELVFAARCRNGLSAAEIMSGLERYRAYLEATGKLGTEYVKEAQFWLSPTYRGWEQPWSLPPDVSAPAFPHYPDGR